jgi:serine phosphatase RsbU (regulator of sigma subunit)
MDNVKHLTCTEVWGGFETVHRPIEMPGLNGCVYSRPFKGSAGGDVHYVSSCASGAFSRVLLADVSGHGKDASQAAARLKQLMRRHVVSHSQAGLVRRVNREFTAATDSGTFATAVIMTYNAKHRRLVVSNAGHPPPLLYRAGTREWSYLHSGLDSQSASRDERVEDLPLGIVDIADYSEHEYRLEAGDTVVCYTDWLTEARDHNGAMLGLDQLLEIARSLPEGSPDDMVLQLLDAVTKWAGAPDQQDDDVTLLLFRAAKEPPRTKMGALLMAPYRMLRAYFGSYLPARA